MSVQVGRGAVIRGWDLVLPWLRVGDKVLATIPAALGYGRKGQPHSIPPIPPDTPLCFEIELLSIDAATPATSLLDAAARGDDLGVGRALADGADANGTTPKGKTALALAAEVGAADCVCRLLEARASPKQACTTGGAAGATPLHFAVKAGSSVASVAALLAAGADVNAATAKGNTPVKLAKDERIATLLQGAGQNVSPNAPLGIGDVGHGPRWESIRARARWERRQADANPRVWLRFGATFLDDKASAALGRVEVTLWADSVPRTAENFRALCTGEKGRSARMERMFNKPSMHYRGCAVHRIVPGQVFQTGDFIFGNGKGGESIYGETFADETFAGKAGSHNRAGLLSMANDGRDSNSSQFFITLDALPHLDGKHVVFGEVTRGLDIVLALAEKSAGSVNAVKIVDCGEVATSD